MRVNSSKVSNFTWLESIRIKLLLWAVFSLVLSLALFRDFWSSLPHMLSPSYILGEYHVSSWGVLVLCLFFLWLKRKEISLGIQNGIKAEGLRGLNFLSLLPGAAVVVGAVLIPFSRDFLTFQVLMAGLGAFVMIFGWWAAKIPGILLAIYGFVIYFPLAIGRFAAAAYTHATLAPLTGLISLLGYPWQNEGYWIRLVSSDGESITAAVTVACAGPTTMSVFIALFVLMMLDMPLPLKKAAGVFVLGVAGTWLQSFIRLVIVIVTGYYLGEDAFWTAHYWTIYALFPLWYLLFAYIYFRVAGRLPGGRRESRAVPVVGD